MKFKVLPLNRSVPSTGTSTAYLKENNWDDWFTYETLYSLILFDADGVRHTAGGVKVGEFGMADGQRRPNIPSPFSALPEEFFSLGQDASYYETLNELSPEERDEVLDALRDVAANPILFAAARKEDVTTTSLLRSVSRAEVQKQFNRLARGGARLTQYRFAYTADRPKATDPEPVHLGFNVEPESSPPTNIHVLIGRNGVGKTRLLSQMTRALVDDTATRRYVGEFSSSDEDFDDTAFSSLVSVSFSAFDEFTVLPQGKQDDDRVRYHYIGLKRAENAGPHAGKPKSTQMLTQEFVSSVHASMLGARRPRWQSALQTLETDPVFREADVSALAEVAELDDSFSEKAKALFARLSSGHKLVLLTTTRLVETVAERTLVLLDEPEAHLHPPLLSAFTRSLSDLLTDRNGVAIIATHSPVILQEVPRSCVWKIRRSGRVVHAERPEAETFGENVGVLTREVFGLEVTHSGFHQVLQEEVTRGGTYEQIVARFDGQLGAEARAILRALLISMT